MKKSMFASVKPLAMATAIAAGTSISMIAVALPGGGDTLGAAGVVNESVCFNTVDMTIASGSRSVTTGTGDCQLRTLVPTKGFQAFDTTPAGATVVDSSALKNAGGESYETYVGGNRKGSLLLTPNRSLAVTRSSSFATGADGSVSFDLGAAVQPATGLQSSWMTGTYNIINRSHGFQQIASGLEHSVYANPNTALGEINSTAAMQVTFNGDGTCSIDAMDNHRSFQLTKDPLDGLGFLEMDNGCTVGGGACAQNDFSNYLARGVVNVGSGGTQNGYYDWNDQNLDGDGGQAVACNYTTAAGVVTVAYETEDFNGGGGTPVDWTVAYNVSADLRYLVAAQTGTLGQTGGAAGPDKGDLSVGVRVGAGDVTGKTYLFNQAVATYAASTPTTPSYENPQSPTYQEEECISRGSIEFTSTSVGGGFNACNVQSVSSCAGRHAGGYEESAAGAADGTIVDSLTAADGVDTDVTACRWSNTGGLVVQMDSTDPDTNPITVNYTGDVSDNGEALVMQGQYSAQGPAPDVENAPLIAQMQFNMIRYMVAQEYQGSLTADEDVDGASNYDEFVWAADVTPAGGSVNTDFNSDATSDLYLRNASTGQSIIWTFNGSKSGSFDLGYTNVGYAFGAIGDVNADGDKDVVLRNATTGELRVLNIQGATLFSSLSLGYNNTAFSFKALADVDADGDKDVILRNDTTGQIIAVVMQAGAKVGQTDIGYNNVALSFKGVGDVDADGDDDLMLRNDTTGQLIVVKVAAGLRDTVTDYGYNNAAFTFKSVIDADGDGDADILLRNDTTGQQIAVISQLGVKAGQNDLSYNSTAMAFQAVGDTDGDGDSDILLRNASGQTIVVRLQGGVNVGVTDLGYNPASMTLVGTGDKDGDGDADIFFRDASTGQTMSYEMQNSAKVAPSQHGYSAAGYAPFVEKK